MTLTTEEVTVSTITTMATTGCHMLKIDGYTRIKNMHGTGHFIESSKFKVAGHTWGILCYPNGRTPTTAGFISVWLMLHGDGVTADASASCVVQAEGRFSLVPQHHRGGLLLPPTCMPYETSHTRAFCWGSMHGCHMFIKQEDLDASLYLKNDGFAVGCDIAIVEKSVVTEPVVWPVDLERLGMVCKCKDGMCKRHHVVGGAQHLKEKFVNIFSGCFLG